jgi:hypothetical protein
MGETHHAWDGGMLSPSFLRGSRILDISSCTAEREPGCVDELGWRILGVMISCWCKGIGVLVAAMSLCHMNVFDHGLGMGGQWFDYQKRHLRGGKG